MYYDMYVILLIAVIHMYLAIIQNNRNKKYIFSSRKVVFAFTIETFWTSPKINDNTSCYKWSIGVKKILVESKNAGAVEKITAAPPPYSELLRSKYFITDITH